MRKTLAIQRSDVTQLLTMGVRMFDITEVGGKSTIPELQRDFLRMYHVKGEDPLRNEWAPVVFEGSEGKSTYCLTTSRGMSFLLEYMGATRLFLPRNRSMLLN